MFGKSSKESTGAAKSMAASSGSSSAKETKLDVDTVIGRNTVIEGNMQFSGGLLIKGVVQGNMSSEDNNATLILEQGGQIQGEVRVPSMVLNGSIEGDVYADGRVQLFENSRIIGDVYYNLLEMEVGAEVNGKLVRQQAVVKPAQVEETSVSESDELAVQEG